MSLRAKPKRTESKTFTDKTGKIIGYVEHRYFSSKSHASHITVRIGEQANEPSSKAVEE
jgi:hypothetical protein